MAGRSCPKHTKKPLRASLQASVLIRRLCREQDGQTLRALRGAASEEGSSLVELALFLPVMILMLLGVVDMGRAIYAAIELSAAASTGAAYGIQNPTDTAGMQKAALLDAADISGATATASYGCECSDGTGAVASCSSTPSCEYNWVYYVQVKTSLNYKPLFSYPGIPSSLALTGTSRMRAGH